MTDDRTPLQSLVYKGLITSFEVNAENSWIIRFNKNDNTVEFNPRYTAKEGSEKAYELLKGMFAGRGVIS